MAKHNQEPDNAFDNLGAPSLTELEIDERLAIQNDMVTKTNEYQYLLHKIFCQSKDGKKLLAMWKEKLINNGVFKDSSNTIDAALNEGEHRFVRGIIKVCDNVARNKR